MQSTESLGSGAPCAPGSGPAEFASQTSGFGFRSLVCTSMVWVFFDAWAFASCSLDGTRIDGKSEANGAWLSTWRLWCAWLMD